MNSQRPQHRQSAESWHEPAANEAAWADLNPEFHQPENTNEEAIDDEA